MNDNLFNSKNIAILVGVLIVAGAATFFYQQSVDREQQQGKAALYKVHLAYEAELAAIPEAERANGSNIDVDVKFSKTVAELKGMLAAKTLPARALYEAGIKLATLYLDHGQADKAIPVLKSVPDFSKTAFQKASAYFLLGAAQERAAQFKEASDSYSQGLSKDVEGLKAELMLGMVRTHLKLGEKEKAKLYLEKLNKEATGSKAALDADALIKGSAEGAAHAS